MNRSFNLILKDPRPEDLGGDGGGKRMAANMDRELTDRTGGELQQLREAHLTQIQKQQTGRMEKDVRSDSNI